MGEPGSAMVPVPLTRVHVPVAGKVGAFPARVVLVLGVHSCWSGPAFAVACAGSKTNRLTWSDVGAPQGPLSIVHCKVT